MALESALSATAQSLFVRQRSENTTMNAEQRLADLGIELPIASNPAANYTNCVLTGSLLFVSGKGPITPGGGAPRGKLGADFTTLEGYEFARTTGLDILAAVRHELGDLNRVRRVVKLQGFVNATPDFEEHPQVLNGASDLMVEVFAERGVHSRSVLGASSLRAGLPIVIESIFEIE
jgi:enamine deaminase RidA (YjgF/YER057c/UK114 family)